MQIVSVDKNKGLKKDVHLQDYNRFVREEEEIADKVNRQSDDVKPLSEVIKIKEANSEIDPRLSKVCRFMTGMFDVKVRRHPLKQRVVITFCDVVRDHYGDTHSTPVERYSKLIILKRNPDLSYINNALGILLDDGKDLPWIMYLSLTGLPRTLRVGDYVTIDNIDYKVSNVKPCNRENPNIIACMLHPNRTDFSVKEQLPFGADVISNLDRLI